MMPGGVICGHFARPFVVHSYGYARLSASQTASQLTSPCIHALRACSQITCTFDSPTLGVLRRCKSLVQQICTARFASRIASQIRRPNVQLIHEQALMDCLGSLVLLNSCSRANGQVVKVTAGQALTVCHDCDRRCQRWKERLVACCASRKGSAPDSSE